MTTYAMMHAIVPARRRRQERERERDQFASARIVQKDSQNILVRAKREKRKRDKNADETHKMRD